MNRVTLIGNLTSDPKLENRGGKDVCDLRVAVDRPGKDGGVDFIDVTVFDKQATACAEHLSKGRQVAVDGRLSYSQWEAEDGSKRSRVKVIGNVTFLGGPRSDAEAPESAEEPQGSEAGEPVPAEF